jgi:hypothetical protein
MSVQVLPSNCFSHCRSLASLTFELGSGLRRIDESAFSNCYSLTWICIPALVEMITHFSLSETNLGSITVEDGNSTFQVRGNFLLDFAGITLIQSFGQFDDAANFRDIEATLEADHSINFAAVGRLCQVK